MTPVCACSSRRGRMSAIVISAALFVFVFRLPASEQKYAEVNFPKKEASRQVVMIPESCHTQGIALDDDYLYLSCVDKKLKKGWLYRVARSEFDNPLRTEPFSFSKLDITEGEKYHASGIDLKGECIWVALAEYHPAPAKLTIKCIDKQTMTQKKAFNIDINDHIGTIAAFDDWILGMNWDAQTFYLVDYSGKILTQGANPGKGSYQDCKYYYGNRIICSGLAGQFSAKGYLDMLEIPGTNPESWQLVKRSVVTQKSKKLMPLTNEAMGFTGSRVCLVPDDLPNPEMYSFRF